MARKKVTKKSTARKKKKASDSDEEAAADFVRNNKARRRSRLDDVSFDDGGGPIVRDSAAARASDRRRAARPPAGGRGVDRWAADEDAGEEALARVHQREALEALHEDDFALDGDDDADEGETRAIAAKPRKSEDSQDFELVGVQTAEERAEANRQRAEQEGDVLEVDDDASDAPPPLGYVCVLKSDGADGERVPLHERLKFGRALDNDVRIPLAKCSRLHAELTVDGRATLQNHARAANTTVLRGETLKPKEARDVNSGDVFEICGRRFRFEAVAPAPAPSPQQAVDVDLTGAPDSDEEEEPDFSPPESAPQSDVDYEEEYDESEEEEESDDDSRANDVCYRCGGRGHWASDCGEPYSYYGYGRY